MNTIDPNAYRRILIIDDTPGIHADFRDVLCPARTGSAESGKLEAALFGEAPSSVEEVVFCLDSAYQGQEALAMVKLNLLKGTPYFMAFVDMRMPPGWDGLETILELWKVQPGLLIVICTAFSDHSWEEIHARLGASDRLLILKKAFDNVEVRQLAHALSARARAEAELAVAQKQMLQSSRQAGMAEVATGVLHNVGNVLNSVNVSAGLLRDGLNKSSLQNLVRATSLLREHENDSIAFLTQDPRGQRLPAFLIKLGDHLVTEHCTWQKELDDLSKNIEHIKEIVAMQQSYAQLAGITEELAAAELVDDALRMNAASFGRHGIQLVREFQAVPPVAACKHKVLQILVNLIRNAKEALDKSGQNIKVLTVGIRPGNAGRVLIQVADNGVGIPPENLERLFQHGFTTKQDGHGFGLHSGIGAAREMGGRLSVHSDGPGHGATFTLELPAVETKQTGTA